MMCYAARVNPKGYYLRGLLEIYRLLRENLEQREAFFDRRGYDRGSPAGRRAA